MIDLEGIKALIPHRPPFLLIDEVVSYDRDHLIARRQVRADEPYFEGHYPGNPIMPGVLISEAIFQAASVFMAKRLEGEADDFSQATPVLARIIDARFKQMVKPGDTLDLEVSFKESISRFHFLRGSAKRDGKVVATVEFALAMVPQS